MKIAICTGIWNVNDDGYYTRLWKKIKVGATYPIEEAKMLGTTDGIMIEGERICAVHSTIGQRYFKIIDCENMTKGV